MAIRDIVQAAAGAGGAKLYAEDVFSTYLYTGNGSTQTINNGIGLSATDSWFYLNAPSISLVKSFHNASSILITGGLSGNLTPIIKLDLTGALVWSRSLSGTSGNDAGKGIIVDPTTSEVIVVGRNENGLAAVVVKYNSAGTIQWQQKLTLSGQTFHFSDVAVDGGSNIYATGYYGYAGGSGSLVAKYNSSGVLQWHKLVVQDTANGAYTGGIIASSAGNVYIGGQAHTGSGNYYAFVLKYDTSGTVLWKRNITVSYDGINAIGLDSSENLYAIGTFNQLATQYAVLLKYNSSGTLQWQRKISSSAGVSGGRIAVDGSDNIYTSVGTTILKYNSSGTLQWQRLLTSAVSSLTADGTLLSVATSGGVILINLDGTTTSGTAGSKTMTTGTLTDGVGAATDAAGTVNSSAGGGTAGIASLTDSGLSTTTVKYTQSAVTGEGGLVWIKDRIGTFSHNLADTERGADNYLFSDGTQAQYDAGTARISSFNSNGFSLGSGSNGTNANVNNHASWTFRKAPKFFDVVTWTGDSTAGREIAHSLGSVPGCVIIKCTSTTTSWQVYHIGAPTGSLVLQSTAALDTVSAKYYFGDDTSIIAPTSTNFTVGGSYAGSQVNGSGATYVAYLFAHDAAGFGDDGLQNVISCGSVVGANQQEVNLGFEPQWILLKNADSAQDWWMVDNMRGWPVQGTDTSYSAKRLNANLSSAESTLSIAPSATGFKANTMTVGQTYIYIAIRRPMKTPEAGTEVFAPLLRTGTGSAATVTGVGFAPDLVILGNRTIVNTRNFWDKLRGVYKYIEPHAQNAESSNTTTVVSFDMNGISLGADNSNTANYPGSTFVNYFFKRAPGFMDVVCFSGTGSSPGTQAHNLGVVPEFVLTKKRNASGDWYPQFQNGSVTSWTQFFALTSAAGVAAGNLSSYISESSFSGNVFSSNNSGATYVAYLFATLAGVSKVGSYTGTGADLNVDCGFSGGARFILIKRTDSTGDWYVWDSARGIAAGNDPYLLLNSAVAEVTNTDYIDPLSSGFTVTSSAPAALNASGGSYLFMAIS